MLITTKNLTKKIIVKNDEDAHLYFEALALVKEEHRTMYMDMNSTVVTSSATEVVPMTDTRYDAEEMANGDIMIDCSPPSEPTAH